MQVLFDDADMQEIFEGFVVESNELLDALQQDLMVLEDQPDDYELLNSIFRNFHTIKGTSGFMGFTDIVAITHHAEDLLNKLRKQDLHVTMQCIDVLLEVWDIISKMLYNKTEGVDEEVSCSEAIEKLEILNRGEVISDNFIPATAESEPITTEEEEEEEEEQINQNVQEAQEAQASGNKAVSDVTDNTLDSILENDAFGDHDGYYNDDELDLIQAAFNQINAEHKKEIKQSSEPIEEVQETGTDEVAEIDEVAIAHEELQDEQDLQDAQELQSSGAKNNSEAVSVPAKSAETTSSSAPKTKKVVAKSAETIRIDVARIETLMDLSGELVLGRNRLSQISDLLDRDTENHEKHVRDLLEAMGSIDLLTSEIQAAVMKMRMVPIAKLYQKAPRIIRDLAKESNKKMKLVLKGEETEIDRGIIEELSDPLTHMIRNSCDHGIEPADVRIASGKPVEGTITLDSDQEGNHIVLKVSDDGAGMDPEFLKAKAMERKVITKEQAEMMSDKEAFQLIFAPGFSTAKKVTSVSGRGVGMDVVRTNIQKLKGIIEIESQKGVGSTFIIKLPLTLAIIQGLLVKVEKEIFAVPLNSVVEVVSIDKKDIHHVNNKEVILIREEVLPVVCLDKVLKLKNKNGIQEEKKEQYVVNVAVGLQSVGLIVNQLIGQEEIVIKSLGNYLGHIKGIAGSTILGDGRPIMILDVGQLLELVYDNNFMSVL